MALPSIFTPRCTPVLFPRATPRTRRGVLSSFFSLDYSKNFFMKWKERSYHPQASGVDSTCML